MSSDADLWGEEDAEFLNALETVKLSLSSDGKSPTKGVKRKASPSPLPERDDDEPHDPDVDPSLIVRKRKKSPVDRSSEAYIYGAAKFGGYGEYMFRKRAKLQIQNKQLSGAPSSDNGGNEKGIFKGVAIYVNGFTDPPFQDLREMVVANGGVFHAYMDRKGMITHIIASQLTPSKIIEYQKAKMRVVKPEWIVRSVEAGELLRWQEFVLEPGLGTVAAHGRGSDFRGVSGHAKGDVDGSELTRRVVKRTLEGAFAVVGTQGKASPKARMKMGSAKVKPTRPTQTIDLTDSPPPEAPPANLPPRNTQDGPSSPEHPTTPSPQKDVTNPLPLLTTTSPTPRRTMPDPNIESESPSESKPSYALYDSNPFAAKLMESTEWRREHTSANAAAFTESYFQNSRLHHLSMWKNELRRLVAEARERAETGMSTPPDASGDPVSMRGARLRMPAKGKGKATAERPERVVMHCDFDSFFVAAGLVERPEMKGRPVVVCHSRRGKASTSEIASASYEARAFGIKNGMSLGQARQLCPDVQTIPYEFEKYKQFSLNFYTILMSVADDLQAVSVDEALIDVSERVALAQAGDDNPDRDHAKELAETIRDKIREETGCEVSVGISHNIMLARLATRRAKPAGSYHLLPADVPEHLAPLGVGAVHGIGSSIRDKIREKFSLETLGELLSKSKEGLQRVLGEKTGEKMWKAARGIDDTQLESDKPRKSVSAEVNYGIRFENNEQAENFIYTLSGEVSKRLKAVNKRGKLLTLKVMVRSKDAPKEAAKFLGHGMADCFSKSTAIGDIRGGATDDEQIIGKETWKLLKAFNFDPTELRGIGIQIQKLDDEAKAEGDVELPPGQSRLQFAKTANEAKASESKTPRATGRVEADAIDVDEIEEEPPPKPRPKSSSRPPTGQSILALPSASQIDTTVLESLPEDIRAEILAEILANLDQPAAGPSKVLEKRANTAPASPPVEVIELVDSEDDDVAVRSQSVPIGGSQERDALVVLQPHKATSTSPTKAARSERSDTKSKASFKVPASKTANVSHITKQLAPKRKIPIASPTKINIFKPRQTSVVDISDRELQSLGVDPKTFRELPADVQKEQISLLKQNAREGSVPHGCGGLLSVPGSRAGSRSRSPSLVLKPRAPAPIPVAQYTELPQIKKLSKLDDIQDMIKEWVQYRQIDGPIPAEVERVSGFLVKCARSDVGLERATAVLRYWRIVLRQKWEAEEASTHVIDLDMDAAGRAWWDAFRRTKRKVDEVVRGRFGCNLSLGR